MGWSCAAKAGLVESMVSLLLKEALGTTSSNEMPGGGFYEVSRREHADGAITGTVWRKLNNAEIAKWSHLPNIEERVAKRGSFKITAEGKIERWPGLPGYIKAEAEKRAAAEYVKRYGGTA